MEARFNPLKTLVDVGFSLYYKMILKGDEPEKIQRVMYATRLCNRDESYPTISKAKPIPTGTEYTFSLPPGIALHEFVERKTYFECFTSGTVEIFPPTGPNLKMYVHHLNFPELIPYNFTPPEDMLAPLPIGIAPSGELIVVDLSELPHILIGGLPGYGKTSLLVGWTVALKQAGVEVFAIDRKRIDFPPLNPWINVAESEQEAAALIGKLLEENERRQEILYKAKARRIQELPPGTLPYMVLIVDEAAAIEAKVTYQGIDSLIRLARATGISILLATQKPSAKLWDQTFSNTRDMCAGRVSFYVSDYMMSQVVLGKGNTAAAGLPMIKGRAVTQFGDRERIVQTMFLPGLQAEAALAELNRPPYFPPIEPVTIEKPKKGRPKKK